MTNPIDALDDELARLEGEGGTTSHVLRLEQSQESSPICEVKAAIDGLVATMEALDGESARNITGNITGATPEQIEAAAKAHVNYYDNDPDERRGWDQMGSHEQAALKDIVTAFLAPVIPPGAVVLTPEDVAQLRRGLEAIDLWWLHDVLGTILEGKGR